MIPEEWDIVPGASVGKFALGTDLEGLKKLIDFDNKVEEYPSDLFILQNEMFLNIGELLLLPKNLGMKTQKLKESR